jgi:hypothetical protein
VPEVAAVAGAAFADGDEGAGAAVAADKRVARSPRRETTRPTQVNRRPLTPAR